MPSKKTQRQEHKLTKGEKNEILTWKRNYTQGVAQRTVRNTSTKFNPGTLPLHSYETSAVTPVQASILGFLQSTHEEQPVLYKKDVALIIKPNFIPVDTTESLTGSFCIGITVSEVIDDPHEQYIQVALHVEVDGMSFEYSGNCRILKEGIVQPYIVNIQHINGEENIKLEEETYHDILKLLNITPGVDDIEEDEKHDENDESGDTNDNYYLTTRTTRTGRRTGWATARFGWQ